jgi:hypothetical protein
MSQTKAQLLGPLVGSNIDVEGDLNFDSGTFKVDPTNDRVGINNANPTKTLDVGGDTQVADLYYTADYPTIRPSLDLVFDKVKRLDSRVTFTRTSTATYVDENGIIQTAAVDEPRFDHDPATGESLGLLIEEQRVNYATNSENLDTWSNGRCIVTANQIISPAGTLTADELKFDNTTTNPLIYKAKPGNGIYVISCFFKKGSVNGAYIYIDNPTLTAAVFDLENGITKAYNDTKFSSTSIEDYGNGWYRCSAITIAISGSNYGFGPCTPESATTGVTCPNDGYVYAWGTQVEAGFFPTSYIPTTGSTVTRSADISSMSGTNLTSWYNSLQGTAYVEFISKYSNGAAGIPSYGFKSTLNSNYYYGMSRDNVAPYHYVNTSTTNAYTYGTLSSDSNYKSVLAIKQNDINSYINGVQNYNTTSVTLFTPDIFYLGYISSSNVLNGHIKRFTYYPRRLNNSQLQNITL